ncbi:polysaccharide deacetylase family protein [Rhizobium sp. NFACC06-2]|uniref:polysaccharide deacetylase family protein n=1 Tax=Rhizobium sp. NFACC06-2 TaxID=1566264 RepID=UPI000875FB73|nr:polysaccharide deacetylase family protein [Rhizobium sp. NFACC06-2]SCY84820.1 Peptidoglycan/xylan/chitin deacetylase, PgdA/CDA1 family [Rhizobium sp. NFACC06-2]
MVREILTLGMVVVVGAVAWSAEQPVPASKGSGAVKFLALTSDDGPTEVTSRILDVLKTRCAKATFFPIAGNVRNDPAVMRRMAFEGHAVGNHTISHARLTEMSPDAARAEIEDAKELLTEVTGLKPTVFRRPYAALNDHVRDILRSNSMTIIMWSINPERFASSASAVRGRVVEAARDGDIVFLHDVSPRAAEATQEIVDELSAKGFEFVTVPELIRRRGKF